MKVYTQQGQKRFDQVKPESINDNTQAVVSVYNGRVDGQNFPIDTIDKLAKLNPKTKIESDVTLEGITSFFG